MADIAVLTRNYSEHLNNAVLSGGLATFYSKVRWARASAALTDKKSVAVYFVANGGKGNIEYQGNITQILLDPVSGTALAEKMLLWTKDDAAKEELQTGTIKTLYSVLGLNKLPQPFSQTKLMKLSDGKSVSKGYDRGYCLVSPLK